MTTEELRELMKDGFDQIHKQLDEIKETLKNIDERLRSIEIDVAEVKGRRLDNNQRLGGYYLRRCCCDSINHNVNE